jgi:hypothetical protein
MDGWSKKLNQTPFDAKIDGASPPCCPHQYGLVHNNPCYQSIIAVKASDTSCESRLEPILFPLIPAPCTIQNGLSALYAVMRMALPIPCFALSGNVFLASAERSNDRCERNFSYRKPETSPVHEPKTPTEQGCTTTRRVPYLIPYSSTRTPKSSGCIPGNRWADEVGGAAGFGYIGREIWPLEQDTSSGT